MTHLFLCTSPACSGWWINLSTQKALPLWHQCSSVLYIPSSHQHLKKGDQDEFAARLPALRPCNFWVPVLPPVQSVLQYGLEPSCWAPWAGGRLLSIRVWRSELVILEIHTSVPTAGQKAVVCVTAYSRSSPGQSSLQQLRKASLFPFTPVPRGTAFP